jgi:hypothetical protein
VFHIQPRSATMDVISQKWPGDRAILFVHGIGSAHPGSYDPLVEQVETILGDAAKKYAIYFFYYDQVNEWFARKEQARLEFTKLVSFLGGLIHSTAVATKSVDVGNAMADFAGDVLWPVLLADARLAVRAALIRQLQQIRADGIQSGNSVADQHLTIIAHSMGCFHVYEALSYAALAPNEGLGPSSGGILDNVILMASPVQLIRTVGGAIRSAVQQPESIYTISKQALDLPSEPGDRGQPVFCTPRFVSITGNLDPVGGYFLRHQYAYMSIPTQQSFVDQQQVATVNGDEELSLTSLFHSALQNMGAPTVAPANPHDWSAYVARHANDLKQWLT